MEKSTRVYSTTEIYLNVSYRYLSEIPMLGGKKENKRHSSCERGKSSPTQRIDDLYCFRHRCCIAMCKAEYALDFYSSFDSEFYESLRQCRLPDMQFLLKD